MFRRRDIQAWSVGIRRVRLAGILVQAYLVSEDIEGATGVLCIERAPLCGSLDARTFRRNSCRVEGGGEILCRAGRLATLHHSNSYVRSLPPQACVCCMTGGSLPCGEGGRTLGASNLEWKALLSLVRLV